jgi:hypothetical protein
MYGVLSADLTFIGLFICTLVISVIFYRLNETSPSSATEVDSVNNFTMEGVNEDNSEINEAIDLLKQEQTKMLSFFKKEIYSKKDLTSISEIKKNIVSDFISSLSLNFEMVSKQELEEIILRLISDLINKNSDYLFEPNFFPSDQTDYASWVRQSLLLLGWRAKKGEDVINRVFFDIFEKNGMVIGVSVYSDASKINLVTKEHEHHIKGGAIDFSVVITPNFQSNMNEKMSDRVIVISHHILPNLLKKLQNFITK